MKYITNAIKNSDFRVINGHVVMVEYDEAGHSIIDDPRENSTLHYIMDMGRRNGGLFESKDGGIDALYDAILAHDKANGIELDEDAEDALYEAYHDGKEEHDLGELLAEADKRGFWIHNTYVYDHSAVVFRSYPFSDPWDSCQNGVAWLSPSELKELTNNGGNPNKELDAVLEDLSNYMNGYIFDVGYAPILSSTIDDEGDEALEIGEFDWVGGFLGHDSVDSYLEELKEELEAPKPQVKQEQYSLLEVV